MVLFIHTSNNTSHENCGILFDRKKAATMTSHTNRTLYSNTGSWGWAYMHVEPRQKKKRQRKHGSPNALLLKLTIRNIFVALLNTFSLRLSLRGWHLPPNQ
jgi:hypothetical protein